MHGVFLATLKHVHEHLRADVLCQSAPVTSHNVQALELVIKGLLLPIDHLDRSVLLLLEQHQAGKHCVDLDLQPPVPLVDGPLDLLSGLHGLVVLSRLRVDKDRVRVAVDDVELQLLLHHRDGILQRLPALRCDQGGQRLRIEAAVLETKAAVHRVGGELQRLLPYLERLQTLGVPLGLDGGLDVPAAFDQPAEHLWQHPLLQHPVRLMRLREQLGLSGTPRHLRLVGPVDGGEADVVLLDDRRVQAVEVEEHHKLVIQAHLRLQHQPSTVGCFAAAPRRRRLVLLLPLCVVEARAHETPLDLHAALLVEHALAIGQHKLLPVELVAQQHLIPLGTLVLER
mmetsp:Transcript_123277/g.343243  ORF Transcript_123277/g.343243 Transcript_123277/m.343243 type:complete len:341 (-) Transcript_123277:2443-3465(-)